MGPGAQPSGVSATGNGDGDRPPDVTRADIDGAAGGDGDRAEEYRPPAAQLRQPGRAIGMPAEKSKNFGAAVRRLLQRMAPEGVRLIAVVALALVSVTLAVIGPKLLGHATDIVVRGFFPEPRGIDFGALHRVLMWAIVLYVSSAVFQYLQARVLAGVVQRTMFTMRADVEDKINRLPLAYVDQQQLGDLLSRVTNDIDNVAQSLQQTLSQLLTSLLTVVGVLVMMVIISPVLALVALVTVPLSLLMVRVVAGRSRPRFIEQWKHTGLLNAQVEETFTGHAIVKSFGRQREVENRFLAKNEELYHASFSAQFVSGIIQPLMMFLGNLNYVGIAVVGGLRVSSGALTIGDIQAFIQYSRQFTQPLTQMASMFNVLQSGIASAERIFEFLDAEDQTLDHEPVAELADPKGRVAFEHVSFSYSPDRPLIEDLSLVAEPGRTVAIVGPTGAGKTTLVNLIMRFYELDRGRITLDGVDIATMHRRDLRANIGMVLQDTWLFGGTIRENIAYGNLDATEEQILEAAKATYVDRFVHSLPHGYDTMIDDEGSERQRGREAADHDRPGVPRRPDDPDPRRGHQLGGHPHRGAHPTRDGGAALGAHELRDRPPPVDDPRRRHDPRDGGGPHRRAGQPRRAARARRRVLQPLQRPVRRRPRRGRVAPVRRRGLDDSTKRPPVGSRRWPRVNTVACS